MKRLVLACLAVLAACSSKKAIVVEEQTVGHVLTAKTEKGLLVERADLNGDGRPEVYSYFKEVKDPKGKTKKVILRRTIDVNSDEKPDITQYFDEAGLLQKEQMDYDYDGIVDCVRTYEKGVVKQEDFSSRFDGKMDVRKVYDNGELVLKLVDTKRVGRFDEFQYYVNGRLDRIGWDRDGDGQPDDFVENPRAAKPKKKRKAEGRKKK